MFRINLRNKTQINEYCNDILEYIKDSSKNEPCDLLHDLFNINGLDFEYRDRRILFDRLYNDGFINQMPNQLNDYDKVFITADGLLFLLNGGYVEQERLQARKEKFDDITFEKLKNENKISNKKFSDFWVCFYHILHGYCLYFL
ncbi:MAG: hypothetical protein HC892_20690 [Saprospiraceae bacterium]|nr:hypothetical protein [Saprospiraceae bacterium]